MELGICQKHFEKYVKNWEFPDKIAKITHLKDLSGEIFLVHNRRGVNVGYQLTKMICDYQGKNRPKITNFDLF